MGGNSNVVAYKIDPTRITVSFSGGLNYVYTYLSAGMTKTEKMKQLAIQGKGLNSFIKTYANNSYAYKFR